ncbi:hypothetical protein MKW94_029929 [Papaver nudicaule]|uniref:Uncharacterized protein n=1 Tax=Papaver nudicaule TaxID=74823 RepID=A0AA41VFV2_PAPNU|nr:hypothetical protein [Papaver nudicaule]
MAKIQSLIIACVFICTLVASKTLMCTAKVDLNCHAVAEDVTVKDVETVKEEDVTGKAVIVGSCYTPEACEATCLGNVNKHGNTDELKRGDCAPDVDRDGQPMVCACCVLQSYS